MYQYFTTSIILRKKAFQHETSSLKYGIGCTHLVQFN